MTTYANKKYTSILIALTLMLSSPACEDKSINEIEPVSCDKFLSAVLNFDSELLANEMAKLTKDLEPNSTSTDKLGHKQNLNTLVQRINNQCDELTIEVLCYACIETNPAQSELLVHTDSLGNQITRVLDIFTPADDALKFGNIHSYY